MTTDTPLDADLFSGGAQPTDAVLVDVVGTGDVDAVLELWRRHRSAAYALARRRDPGSASTESAVNRAFADVLLEIAAGRDVDGPFRLHLYRTLFADSLRLDVRDAPRVVRAFGALSARSRTVLWYLVVEDEARPAVALMAGVPTDALHGLLRLAEVELRTQWLTEIVDSPSTPSACAWTVTRLDLHRCRVLAPSTEARVDRHLAACAWCQHVVHDLGDVPGLLRRATLSLVCADDRSLRCRCGSAYPAAEIRAT